MRPPCSCTISLHNAKPKPAPPFFRPTCTKLGYETPQTGELDVATRHVLAAFQMHFRPSRFDGTPDAESAAILNVLNTQR
ncbi:MAG: peptidoglycan-binding protein [Pseudomonas helleri]|jgi:N-acetylmuramoyl-L-alanine amidase